MESKIYFTRNFNNIVITLFLLFVYMILYLFYGSDMRFGIIHTSVFMGVLVFTRPFQGYVYFEGSNMLIKYSIFKKQECFNVNSLVKAVINFNPKDSFLILETENNIKCDVHMRVSVMEKILKEIESRKGNSILNLNMNKNIIRFSAFRFRILFLTFLNLFLFFFDQSIFLLFAVCLYQIFEFYESTSTLLYSEGSCFTLATFDMTESYTFKSNEVKSLDFLKIGGFIFPRCRFSLKDGSKIRFKVDNYKKLIELINSNSETLVPINFKWFNWFKFSNVKSSMD